MGYCFVCDAPAEGESCPTCGTALWTGDRQETHDHAPTVVADPEKPLAEPPPEISSPDPPAAGPVGHPIEPGSVGIPQNSAGEPIGSHPTGGVMHLDPVPVLADRTPRSHDGVSPRWILLAAAVLVMLVVAIRIPTGREDVPNENLGEITSPATPLPEPQRYDLVWVPGDNTTVAVLGEGDSPVLAIRRFGPLDPIYASSVASRNAEGPAGAVDITPDGFVIAWDGDVASFWAPALGLFDQVATGVTAAPVLSPTGDRLAVPVGTALFVYDVANAFPGTSFAEVVTTAVSDVPIEVVHWSPDGRFVAGAGSREWVVFDAVTGVTEVRGRDRLLGFDSRRRGFNTSVAVQIDDDLELRANDGSVVRTWPDLLADEDATNSQRAEFSPDGRHLAVQSNRPDAAAVWVLDLLAINQVRVGFRPAVGTDRTLTWSGDGRALYWLDGGQLVAWLTTTHQTVLISERDDPADFPQRIHGIRIYDQALVPTGQRIERPAQPVSLMADGVILSQFEESIVIDREILRAPEGATLIGGASVVDPDAVRWGAEFDNGQIVFLAGEAWTMTRGGFVTVDGTSLTSVAGQFVWLADGNLYSEASMPDPLITGEALGPGEILAVAGVRDSLMVVFQDAGGVAASLWQIPGWSDELSEPLIPNRGAVLPSSPFALNVVWPGTSAAHMLRNLQSDSFTVTLESRTDGTNHGQLFFYPQFDVSSICGVQLGACTGDRFSGTPLTYSPDGHWLLVEHRGPNSAVSTNARGVIAQDEDTALWQP